MAKDRGDGRKLTYSERDKLLRSKKKGQEPDWKQEQLSHTQSYIDYKKSVEKIFGGGGDVPEQMKGALDPSGEKGKRTVALKELAALAQENRKAWAEAVVQFVQDHELPDDPYFLVGLLDHPKDRVVDKALGKLEQLATEDKLVGAKKPKSLEQRLRSIELTSLDDEQQARAKALREKLF
jgi:hypothetical protein